MVDLPHDEPSIQGAPLDGRLRQQPPLDTAAALSRVAEEFALGDSRIYMEPVQTGGAMKGFLHTPDASSR